MKVGVVVFPGSNCDQDMIHVMEKLTGNPVQKLWHKEHDLKGSDLIILPGGFSYGDYLRSGAIARFSPVMEEVIAFSKKGGQVLGVCNGFQILCEAGLLPGTLQHNTNHRFICKNVFLKAQSKSAVISKDIPEERVLKIPIAHGEGRYFDHPDALKALNDHDQVLFRYCDENGQITEASNPNGSLENIAGVCNVGKNVFGMMPHPERAADPLLGNEDGTIILESILNLQTA
jgi:phosphoribosylformylglycinamidine synthase